MTVNVYNQSGLSLNDYLVQQALQKNQLGSTWSLPQNNVVQQQPQQQQSIFGQNQNPQQKQIFGPSQGNFQTTQQQSQIQQPIIDPFLASNPQFQERLLIFPKEIKNDNVNYSELLGNQQKSISSSVPTLNINVKQLVKSPVIALQPQKQENYIEFPNFSYKLRFEIEAFANNYDILEITETFAKYK
ncbi:hypothetical protein SS50377_22463 [Spironucleus salmonicida]|nr:hypothetical protein SS50377_22463 [Spironucleus salmonicida]